MNEDDVAALNEGGCGNCATVCMREWIDILAFIRHFVSRSFFISYRCAIGNLALEISVRRYQITYCSACNVKLLADEHIFWACYRTRHFILFEACCSNSVYWFQS